MTHQPALYTAWEPSEAEIELLKQNPKRRKLEPGSSVGKYLYFFDYFSPCYQVCVDFII